MKKLKDIWDELPVLSFTKKTVCEKTGLRLYIIAGKTFQETAGIKYVLDILRKFEQEYGARARMAAKNEGIDGKALSHAIRAAIQVKSILTDGDIVFPLKEAPYLLKVKQGKLDYSTQVAPVLEELMDEVKALSDKSPLPNEVDTHVWDEWLIRVYETRLFTGCCRR